MNKLIIFCIGFVLVAVGFSPSKPSVGHDCETSAELSQKHSA